MLRKKYKGKSKKIGDYKIMFFWNLGLVPFLVIGILILVFARPMAGLGFRRKQDALPDNPTFIQIFALWSIRLVGIVGIFIFFYMGIDRSWMGEMKKVKNQITLLEHGEIAEGKVIRRWYDEWAPSSWMVLYSFEATNPGDGKSKTYYGSARGPKQYYSHLSSGNRVSIIYNPSNPKLNCEMYRFLNYPGYRRTFRQAGKTDLLLMRFKDKYTFESYSYMTWLDSAREK